VPSAAFSGKPSNADGVSTSAARIAPSASCVIPPTIMVEKTYRFQILLRGATRRVEWVALYEEPEQDGPAL
jgi:hypothetical protein